MPFDGVVQNKNGEEAKLVKYAKSKGVQFFTEFLVNKININNNRVSSVEVNEAHFWNFN